MIRLGIFRFPGDLPIYEFFKCYIDIDILSFVLTYQTLPCALQITDKQKIEITKSVYTNGNQTCVFESGRAHHSSPLRLSSAIF